MPYLEYFQSVLFKFDKAKAPEKFYLICFFCKDFKLLIRARIEQQGQKIDSSTKIIKNAVDTKA